MRTHNGGSPDPFFSRVIIRSQDRKSGTTSSLACALPHPIVGTFTAQYITVPNTVYNVNSTNNTFVVSNSVFPGGVLVTIPIGNYQLSGATNLLQTQVQGQIAAIAGGSFNAWTVILDSVTNRLTFRPANQNTPCSVFSTGAGASLLGLISGTPINIPILPLSSTATAPNPVGFYTPLSIGMRINNAQDMSTVTSTTDATVQTTFVVPWLAGAGLFNFTSQDVFTQGVTFRTPTRQLSIDIIDLTTGGILEMNGGEWELFLTKNSRLQTIMDA
jgi:hypothetical protein